MNTDQARYNLNSLKSRYILFRATEVLLLAIGASLLVFAISGFLIVSVEAKLGLAAGVGLLLLITRFLHLNLHRLSNNKLIQFVNERYPIFQESADLLLHPDENLIGLQLLQKEIILQRFQQLYPTIKLPHRMGQAAGIFLGCSIVYVALSGFAITAERVKESKTKTMAEQIKPINTDAKEVSIETISIQVKPPVYTGLAPFKPSNLALSIPEGSSVNWLVEFSEQINSAKIIFSGRDSVKMKKTHGLSFGINQTLSTSGFYQIQWRDQLTVHAGRQETYRSDYFRIDVIKDQPPKISVSNLQQFTELTYKDKLSIEVKSTLSDDYGLGNAQIIATVSKGSGEGIKFREEKIRFSSPSKIAGKQVIAQSTLDLTKLGLEPGDELYFYVEAIDNKTPVANRNRTETFFISLKDTASYALVSDEGLGVDLMPEYFRSQRQIIIDTEKLLKQQKQITKQQFNFTSNELGFDQKTLRLRYGQFLGEEADSGIPQGTEEEHADDEEGEEKDPTKAPGHEHDTKNEHNIVADKKIDLHNHDNKTSVDEEEEEDPLKAFIHDHDNQEEATFFIVSIKTKLKMALTVMWDAELHLRLYDPAKSLPYQYKALNLLKEISNDSRIYVHRMGFDPPPLKEEKRLTADLTEVKSSTNLYKIENRKNFPAIREAISVLEVLTAQKEPKLTPAFKKTLTKAGEELALLSVEQPGEFLNSLSLIRNLVDDNVTSKKMKVSLIALQHQLWSILPQQPTSARKNSTTAHELDRKFMEQLDELKHE